MTPQKRGPKSKRSPLDEENQKLRRENQHLSEELRKAEIVIDIQKKWLLCWGVRFARRSYLYVILDVFSRYVVGWMVAPREQTLRE